MGTSHCQCSVLDCNVLPLRSLQLAQRNVSVLVSLSCTAILVFRVKLCENLFRGCHGVPALFEFGEPFRRAIVHHGCAYLPEGRTCIFEALHRVPAPDLQPLFYRIKICAVVVQ